jgi:hypothetical protein
MPCGTGGPCVGEATRIPPGRPGYTLVGRDWVPNDQLPAAVTLVMVDPVWQAERRAAGRGPDGMPLVERVCVHGQPVDCYLDPDSRRDIVDGTITFNRVDGVEIDGAELRRILAAQ